MEKLRNAFPDDSMWALSQDSGITLTSRVLQFSNSDASAKIRMTRAGTQMTWEPREVIVGRMYALF